MTDVPPASALPDGLVACEQWVCWRQQQRDGKQTKVPINPHNSRFGSATDPETWSDFETAHETAVAGSADGIGFVFTDNDPFVGVDLDDCRVPETGTLTDDSASIVAQLDSYTEVSPSGTGVHVLVDGTLPEGRNRRDWVECYETARFFTVTGAHVDGTPRTIEARTSELAAVHSGFVAPETRGSTEAETVQPAGATTTTDPTATDDLAGESATAPGLSDADLVERAQSAANGEKFSRLWRGSTSGYDSHSEADMALCSLLAFWTGGDGQQIDRLFRESGLLREKWDEQHFADGSTYGEKTIERVIATTDEVYDPGSSQRSAPSTESTDADRRLSGELPAKPSESPEQASVRGTTSDTASSNTTSDDLPAGDTKLLELVDRLQTQVERLEHENQRLRSELEARPEPGLTGEEPGSTKGWFRSLFSW